MSKHPYIDYEKHPAWGVIAQALSELEANGDLEATTASNYIVGFLMKKLEESGSLLSADASGQLQVSSNALSGNGTKIFKYVLKKTRQGKGPVFGNMTTSPIIPSAAKYGTPIHAASHVAEDPVDYPKAKPGTQHARVLACLKSVGARPITRAEKIRTKKFGLIGMPAE